MISLRTFIRATILILLSGMLIASASLAMPILLQLPPDRPGCDVPIHWKLGTVDPRFPVDEHTFRKSVYEAEAIWEKGLEKNLFVYDPASHFVITTSYDDRQKMTEEAAALEERYQRYQETSSALKAQYDDLKAQYDNDYSAFQSRSAIYEKKLAKYNADVQTANASGSITKEEFDALEKRRKNLEKERDILSRTSGDINALASKINALASKLNLSTKTLNENIRTFRDTYGEPQPFTEGLYDPNVPSITIFQFKRQDDLRLALTHELGHALGIEEHVKDNPAAIMYYLMGEQDIDHPALTDDDKTAHATVCPERTLSKRETIARYLVLTPFSDIRFEALLRIVAE